MPRATSSARRRRAPLSRHWSAEAGQARNAAVTDATGLVERYSHDVSTGMAHSRGVSESESTQAQELQSHVDKLAEIGGISKSQAMNLTGEAKVGGGWNLIAKIGADGSAMWRGQTIESDAWNRMREYDRQHGVTESWSKVAEASRRYSAQTGDSEMASLDESLSANLTRMRSFQERASLSRQESESWSEQAAQVRSDAQAIERDLGQPFFAWHLGAQRRGRRAIGAAGAMRIASPQTPEDAEGLREHAAAFIAEKFPIRDLVAGGTRSGDGRRRGGIRRGARHALGRLCRRDRRGLRGLVGRVAATAPMSRARRYRARSRPPRAGNARRRRPT